MLLPQPDGPDDREELAFVDVDVEIVQRSHRAAVGRPECQVDVAALDVRHRLPTLSGACVGALSSALLKHIRAAIGRRNVAGEDQTPADLARLMPSATIRLSKSG